MLAWGAGLVKRRHQQKRSRKGAKQAKTAKKKGKGSSCALCFLGVFA
jgi:hypothetical protein